MFTTVEHVATFGYAVSNDLIAQAQAVIETHIGRVEADVTAANDLALLRLATTFQTIYMQAHPELVFEQIAAVSITQSGTSTTFDADYSSPFIAPMAHKACRNLSWRGSRSYRTGPLTGLPTLTFQEAWRTDLI